MFVPGDIRVIRTPKSATNVAKRHHPGCVIAFQFVTAPNSCRLAQIKDVYPLLLARATLGVPIWPRQSSGTAQLIHSTRLESKVECTGSNPNLRRASESRSKDDHLL